MTFVLPDLGLAGLSLQISPNLVQQTFSEFIARSYKNHTLIYMDGSKNVHRRESAFAIPSLQVQESHRIGKFSSSFSAELYAIYRGPNVGQFAQTYSSAHPLGLSICSGSFDPIDSSTASPRLQNTCLVISAKSAEDNDRYRMDSWAFRQWISGQAGSESLFNKVLRYLRHSPVNTREQVVGA